VTESRKGLVYGIAAYSLWGVIPIYWKLLADISPVEVLAHRALWGLGAFVALALIAGEWPAVRAAMRDRRTVAVMAVSGALLAVNWGTFVAAVATGHLLDASLGYFINPLVSVALGMVVLGERLRRLQWLAIGLAATGVGLITVEAGRVPWISLVLAGTFGLYGLVRKTAKVDSLAGSTIETAIMTPVAIAYLALLAARGGGALGRIDVATDLLLVSTGVITAVPLLLFTSAARRLPLSMVGFLQYLAPTGQFLLAVLAFGEPFSTGRLAAFACIWAGLAVFSSDFFRREAALRRRRSAPGAG
jgi:chloramphenicol-sensitive protein RarD